MLLILVFAINVVSFWYFDTMSTNCDIKLEVNGINSFEFVAFLPSSSGGYMTLICFEIIIFDFRRM
jgi:hypothetical protein